jgi:hypothetical protein
VNSKKNDVAAWISANLSKEEGDRLKSILDKNSLLKELEGIGRKKPEPQKDKGESKLAGVKGDKGEEDKKEKEGLVKGGGNAKKPASKGKIINKKDSIKK